MHDAFGALLKPCFSKLLAENITKLRFWSYLNTKLTSETTPLVHKKSIWFTFCKIFFLAIYLIWNSQFRVKCLSDIFILLKLCITYILVWPQWYSFEVKGQTDSRCLSPDFNFNFFSLGSFLEDRVFQK